MAPTRIGVQLRGTPATPFGMLARFVLRHTRATQCLMLILSVLSVGLVTQIRVDSDLLNLMPSDLSTIEALRDLEDREEGVSVVSVAVSGAPEDTHAFLSELAETLREDARYRYVLYDIESELAWRIGVLQLDEEELAAVRDRLTGALALGPAISNPLIASRLLDLGPMTARLRDAGLESRGFLSRGEINRMIIRPTTSAHDLPFAREIMASLDEEIEKLDPKARGVEVAWIGGAYRHNVEDYEGIVHDGRWTGICSLFLVLGFITLAFRDPRAVALIFIPLSLGTLWTFGFAAVSLGQLNSFTSFFGAILLGLGVDFSIHLYSRYREERANSDSLEEAVIRAWDRVGPPCLAAAVTTAGGFSALLFAHFGGFSQLGLLLAVGVPACLFSVLTVLPLLIQWRERRPVRRTKAPLGPGFSPPLPTYRFAPVALGLAVLFTVVCAFMVPRIGFEYDLSELRRDGLAFSDLSETQQRLVQDSYAPLIVSYKSEESVRSAHERYAAEIEAGTFSEIERVISLSSMLPTDQTKRLAVLAEIASLSEDDNYRYLPSPIRKNLTRLVDTPLRPLEIADLPFGVQHILGVSGDSYRLLMAPAGNMWDLRDTASLLHGVEDKVQDGPVAGEYLALGSLYELVRRDMPVVGGAALVLVCIGTLLDLRRPVYAIGAIFVLLAGMTWAGGAISVVGIRLSIVNVVGIPILLGIGVDVVIHLLHRIAEEGPGRVMVAMETTGYAAILSATTTVLSFASLTMASSMGIRSLGLLVLVGLTSVTLGAFALIPVGWMTAWKVGGDLPPGMDAE